MARPKRPVRKLKTGTVHYVDRRIDNFLVYKNILSRQTSANFIPQNFKWFHIHKPPANTSLMVLDHTSFFGNPYVKVLASNSEGDNYIGYMYLGEFLYVITGKPVWELVKKSS